MENLEKNLNLSHLGKIIVYDKDKVIQIWPEFDIDGAVELQYTFRLIQTGADGALIEQIILTDDMLDSPLEIPTKPFDAYISVTVKARGTGRYI